MNPYDFVRIDWKRPPERHRPVWHHRLIGQGSQPLYSGHIDVDVYTETPIFIPERANTTRNADPSKPEQFMRNGQGKYIIPGSSLKGMLRCVVEALGNGCLTLFDGNYESYRTAQNRTEYRAPYKDKVEGAFRRCYKSTELCIACRTFGMLRVKGERDEERDEEESQGVFLGKVNIGDAVALPNRVYVYEKPIYTKPLMNPKPRHANFYLNESGEHIAGRKFYFHHPQDLEPLTDNRLIYFGNNPEPANRYIQPLDYDTGFHFRVDFTNLEEDEFGALLLAIVLEDNMRHKIGYAKPLGLGTVELIPTSLTLVDFAARYTERSPDRGITTLEGDAMWAKVKQHIGHFSQTHLVPAAMDDLRRIWRWPPEPGVDYYYPSKRQWFDTPDSKGKRIADTRDVPRQA